VTVSVLNVSVKDCCCVLQAESAQDISRVATTTYK